MNNTNLNILILTASFGNGHKSVANTIKNEFISYGYDNITICDLYKESHPFVNNVTKQAYIKSYDHGHLYSLYYNGIEKLAHSSVGAWYRKLGKEYLKELISQLQPDMIINTFPIMVSSELKRKFDLPIPVYSIITDYCVHKIWLTDHITKYYIAHKDLTKPLIEWGINSNQIYVSGIPIKKDFEMPIHPSVSFQFLKDTYNISDKKIVLINAGAFGVMKDITNVCNLLDEFANIQTLVICGKNKRLKNDLEKEYYENVIPLGYIYDIHHFYRSASCLITKPGGITLSEASSCRLPLILFNPVPGQEMHNAKFFESKEAGIIAYTHEEILKGVIQLLTNPYQHKKIKNSLENLYQRGAAKNIVEDILKQTKRKCTINQNKQDPIIDYKFLANINSGDKS